MSDAPQARDLRASSFGQAADTYQRYRPGPPLEAVQWVLPERVAVAVDLGAGTGGLTRVLVELADEVLAVEPDDQMRAVLAREVPAARALDGRGEDLPIADASVDAILASASWHWMDPDLAIREAARVLRPGGVIATMWAGPDPDGAFVAQARGALGGGGDGGDTGTVLRETIDGGTDAPARVLEIPEGVGFEPPERRDFHWVVPLTADDLVGLLQTLSWVILLDEARREQLVVRARTLLKEALGIEGPVTVDVDFACETHRARFTR